MRAAQVLVVAMLRSAAALRPGASAAARAAKRLRLASTLTPAAPVSAAPAPPPPGGDVHGYLAKAAAYALGREFGAEFGTERYAALNVATKKEFGDFQCNAALALSKKLGAPRPPRDVAADIVRALEADAGVASVVSFPLEIAGPGFVNLRLSDDYLARTAAAMAADADGRCGVPRAAAPQTVVVDYSSPNIAKEMHVGHLRSTVIGDALANCLEFAGHDVRRVNHVGDWGTQFGMLLAHLDDVAPVGGDAGAPELGDLVAFYKEAKARFDADEAFKLRARDNVVALQGGDARSLAAWKRLCAASRVEFDAIYDRLGVAGLEEVGESFYNDRLEATVAALGDLAEPSEGATVVWPPGDPETRGNPMIVRKSDGGFLYATTDLAAAAYRCGDLRADRVLYVTDAGQGPHFAAVFEAAKRAALVAGDALLEHVPFGLVRGEDGKKFATRSGETVRLKDLLDEAERRALADLRARRDDRNAEDGSDASLDFDDAELAALAKAVGIGAVKYADLSLNRESNYKFSYGKMLALTGNTAPYMLYSYARINGIRRRAAERGDAAAGDAAVVFDDDAERALARHLALLAPTLVNLERDLRPNALCDYLFELAQIFNRFYESCPVTQAPTPELAASRAKLCAATAGALKLGLSTILGIPVVDRM